MSSSIADNLSEFNVSTMPMRPGTSEDCQNHNCNGVDGGVCAFVPNHLVTWCCTPNSPACWRTRLSCGSYTPGGVLVIGLQLCSLGGFYWCCSADFDSCPPAERYGQCEPRGLLNPARNGPVWGLNVTVAAVDPPASANTTAAVAAPPAIGALEPAASGGLSPVAVGAGVGAAVGVALVAAAGYAIWRHGKRAKAVASGEVAEMSTDSARVEMMAESPVEMPAARRLSEMPAEPVSWNGVHEMDAARE